MIYTHLIGVHVALGTTASLVDNKRELPDQLARDDLFLPLRTSTCESYTPERTSSAAFPIASPTFGSMPYPTFTIEAAFFSTPKALMRGSGRRSAAPPMSKFCSELYNRPCSGQICALTRSKE